MLFHERRRVNSVWLSLACALAVAGGICSADEPPARLAVTASQNTKAILLYDVFEITFIHENSYKNPFFDANVSVVFTAPSGRTLQVGGFFYGSIDMPRVTVKEGQRGPKQVTYKYDKSNAWKARLAAIEVGQWRYTWTFSDAAGKAQGAGKFACVKGRTSAHGFVRISTGNPFRFVFGDGAPFYPVGLQECIGDGGCGSFLAAMSLEGPFRLDRRPDWPALPKDSPLFKPGPSTNPVNADVYFRRYSRCGFNFFRFSQRNCSPLLYDDLDHYRIHEARMVDELLTHCVKYKMRIMYGLFGSYGNTPPGGDGPEDAVVMDKVMRFLKYSVDRWGAYVDIWEMFNESNVKQDEWFAIAVPYLRSVDPYQHPVTTSNQRPDLPQIDINAPHWYGRENDLAADKYVAQLATSAKKFGKPVVVGEQGNAVGDMKKAPPGSGGVWDPTSAMRMRIRLWACQFNEICFIFWNTSYAKDGHVMNIWLGPYERQYVSALQAFSRRLDTGVKMVKVDVSDAKSVRAYGLASSAVAAAYLHHGANHEAPVRALTVTLDVPVAGTAWWYDPATGAILGKGDAARGRQTFTAPDFTVDLALLITAAGPPDNDGDGKTNDWDHDDDNDGVKDVDDVFPLEPEEWQDRDADMIGDVLDADKNGDGVGDDDNGNGIPDRDEMDIDGDGYPRAKAVPWDAFPWNPKEWADTDSDGIGDNSDPDIDGDGWTNDEEKAAGTDLRSRLSFPY